MGDEFILLFKCIAT